MSGKTLTLLGILVFVVLVLGSFIGFIVNWDKTKEPSVTRAFPEVTEERQI